MVTSILAIGEERVEEEILEVMTSSMVESAMADLSWDNCTQDCRD